MVIPENPLLPFFAYGIFKRGQISYYCIKNFVTNNTKPTSVNGRLYVRDGIPLLDRSGDDLEIQGELISFKDGCEIEAYQSIVNLEPQKYYRWEVIETTKGQANALLGKSPQKGSISETNNWDSWQDPLFTTVFEIIEEELAHDEIDMDGKTFLRLQMTYMLLWSAIERFVSLRYNFRGKDIRAKILTLAENEKFVSQLLRVKAPHRDIYSTDNVEEKFKFDATNPRACLDYYYQIRCNITHRGKAAIADIKLVRQCLRELGHIFDELIYSAKKDIP